MLGRCLVTANKRGNFDIITVVLGSDTKKIRTRDSIRLIEYAHANYELVDIGEMARTQFEEWRRENQNNIYINKGLEDNISLRLDKGLHGLFPVNKDDVKDIVIEIVATDYLDAPVVQNSVIRYCRNTNRRYRIREHRYTCYERHTTNWRVPLFFRNNF